jgi:hypothetical protein
VDKIPNDSDEGTTEAPVLLFRAGLTPKIEARLGWDGYSSNGAEGTLNTQSGLKIDALNQNGFVPDLAAIPEVVLPTGDYEVASDKVEPAVRLPAGYDLTDSVSVGGNLNFAARCVQESEERFLEFAASTVLDVPCTSSFGSYIEYYTILPDDPAHSSLVVAGNFHGMRIV